MKQITPKAVKEMIDSGQPLMILDVREDWELAAANLPGAVHITMDMLPESLDQIPKDQDVVVVCHHGGRSTQVAFWLSTQGYTRVMNLVGGIDRWAVEVDQNLPRY